MIEQICTKIVIVCVTVAVAVVFGGFAVLAVRALINEVRGR